jgi:hypothetical protein
VRVQWVWLSIFLTACAGTQVSAPPPERASAPLPARESIAERETRADSRVNVAGIEGSLSGSEVRRAMEKRGRAFAACHEARAKQLPRLAGSIEFAIRVAGDGQVLQVDVRASDLGDRQLERCFVEVIAGMPFPSPNGGEAKVTWTMALGPARPGADPEKWEKQRIQRVLSKRLPELRASCSLPHVGAFMVTAYINRSGRVVTAGVSTRDDTEPEQLDCIAEALRTWRMPSPRKGSLAKVRFPVGAAGM